jgi:hypothetical protein
MWAVRVKRIEEEERGGGWSYSTRGATVPDGTVYARAAENRRLGL